MTVTIGNGTISGINRGYPGTPSRARTRSGLLDDGVISSADLNSNYWYRSGGSSSGWIRLGSGLIVQYGESFGFADSLTSHYFPITFPNNVIMISIIIREWWNRGTWELRATTYTNSYFYFRMTNGGTTTTEDPGWELSSSQFYYQYTATGY